eukprot:2225078-Amphidinium_carterae.2
MAADSVEIRRAWSQAFVNGQDKLLAAERLLPLVHLLPHHLLDPGKCCSAGRVREGACLRTLVCCWGKFTVGDNRLNRTLSLYGNGSGVQGRDMVGDCNGCFFLLAPSILSHVVEQVPAMPPRRVITFSEHAEGGTPRSSEAFALWPMADGAEGLEMKNMLYLDVDSDVLRAWVAGGEEDWPEGDLQRA